MDDSLPHDHGPRDGPWRSPLPNPAMPKVESDSGNPFYDLDGLMARVEPPRHGDIVRFTGSGLIMRMVDPRVAGHDANGSPTAEFDA